MRLLVVVLVLLAVTACSDTGGTKTEDKSKRPVGMSEDIWKVYGGAESGVTEEKKDSPDEKKKDAPQEKK